MVRSGGVNKPNWLCTVDRLSQGAMEECILHIKLMNRSGKGECQGENYRNCN
jgi:hypothetical protein